MVFPLPIRDANQLDIRKLGVIIRDLNTLAINTDCLSVDLSLVINTECFEAYKNTRILSDQVIYECLAFFEQHSIAQADMYISVYKDCMIDDRPITIPVSYSTLYNAIVTVYERWFDSKPLARRTVLHLAPTDTYPAILIQPHRNKELNTITRHPKTGQLMQDGDGLNIIHCSHSVLTEPEERMIKAVDMVLDLPQKISYLYGCGETCVIRRTVEYPMTAQAKVSHILEKYLNNSFSSEKAVSLIFPEYIAAIDEEKYALSAKNQYSGMDAFFRIPIAGKAVFRWSDYSTITKESIFLGDEACPDDIKLIEICAGCIFSFGGMTSHASVFCRRFGITCIVAARDLSIDWQNKVAHTSCGETIHEGDKICITRTRWSVGGEIIPDSTYRAVCSVHTMDKLRELILPYSDTRKLKQYPLEFQFHISNLIRALNSISGWFD